MAHNEPFLVWFRNVSKQTIESVAFVGGIEIQGIDDLGPIKAWYPSRCTCIPLPLSDAHTLCTNQCGCKHALNVALSVG